MNAIIFAAGLGTRLKPLTDKTPKALVPVAGKPMLEHAILKLKSFGFNNIVINIHHFGEQIIEFLEKNNYFGINIIVSDERKLLLDTGGGIKKAAPLFTSKEPFLVYNVDIVTDLDLYSFYESHKANNAMVTLLVGERKTQRYLLFDRKLRLCGWKNEKTGEIKTPYEELDEKASRKYAFGGVHVLSYEVLDHMKAWEGKFSVIDFYLSVASQLPIIAYPAPAGMQWCDIGKPETLEQFKGTEGCL